MIYEYNDALFTFNSARFAELLMPEDLQISRAKRKRDLIEKAKLCVEAQTVESWFKKKSTPSSIDLIIKIAHYLEVDPNELLVPYDPIRDKIKDAFAENPTLASSTASEFLKDWLLNQRPMDDQNHCKKGLRYTLIGHLPNGFIHLLYIYIYLEFLTIQNTAVQRAVAPLLFCILFKLVRFVITGMLEDSIRLKVFQITLKTGEWIFTAIMIYHIIVTHF